VIAFVALALTGQSCIAQQAVSYAPVQYQQQAYNQAYVEKTIFVAVEAQDAPTYYGGLVATQQRAAERQAQAQQATASTDARIEQLTRAIEALQKRLETQASEPALPSHPGQTPAPPVPSLSPVSSEAAPPPPTIAQASTSISARKGITPGLALLVSKCGACHTGAAQKGRGFKILAPDGSLAKLDAVSLDAIDAAITSGRMPKRAPNLTLREYAAIRDYLNEQAGGLALNTVQRRKIR
jgi:mono/diheme cytochrome c family protein